MREKHRHYAIFVFTRDSRMLRASLPSSGRLSVCPSVRPSVCHTRDLYQNGARWDHEIFTVDCPKVSSLSWQNFVPLDAGVPLERGRHREVPPWKDVILPLLARIMWKRLQIGTYMLLIITSTGNKLFIAVNVDNFEWPWTLKIGVLVNFSAIFGCDTHFKSELRQNG